MFHHNTIRKYTLAMLNFFSNLEVEYKNEREQIIQKKIPIHYKFREKEILMTQTEDQIVTGNLNVLPRAVLELSSFSVDTSRQSSKYNKIHQLRLPQSQEYQYNSVAYTFVYSLKILCRGMNEACQIVEEIAPKFNPNVAIDVFDAENESTPTRVPIQLGSIGIETEGFEDKSMNICTVSAEFTLSGYLFQPIKEYSLIKQLTMNFNTPYRETEETDFKVIDGKPQFAPKHRVLNQDEIDYSTRLYIEPLELVKEGNVITCKYKTNYDKDPKITFISQTVEIEMVSKNSCSINGSGDVCAILEAENVRASILARF